MALSRWVITAPVSVPAGTPTAVAGGLGTVSWLGAAGVYSDGMPQTFVEGQVILLDSAGGTSSLYAYLNAAGVLRAYVPGSDDAGHAALAN
jgi:hypothetical protein